MDVAKAIRMMVTQGGGPLEAALIAMIHTYRYDRDNLSEAAAELSSARSTNTTMMRTLKELMARYSAGESFEAVADEIFMRFDKRYDKISDYGESLINDGDGILTTCFPEHSFILSVAKAIKKGKKVKVFVPETRPYFQGAHLTEPSLRELGIECYLITDGMPAHFMAQGEIKLYMTAADLALNDKTVVNKTGTLSNAIAAKYHKIPYYAFSAGIDGAKTKDDIAIEYRPGDEIKRYGSWQIADENAKPIYPCFDIIGADLVSGIITEDGIIR
jgi:methylthioribose-1-phosphate isomerase